MKKSLKVIYLSYNLWHELYYSDVHMVCTAKYEYYQRRRHVGFGTEIRNYRVNLQTGETEEIQIRCKH